MSVRKSAHLDQRAEAIFRIMRDAENHGDRALAQEWAPELAWVEAEAELERSRGN